MTKRLLTHGDIAEWFGVGRAAVQMWTARYDDTPEPDYITDGHPGWLPRREAQWRRWYKHKWPDR